MDNFTIEKCYLKNTHHYAFRPGVPAEIIGVVVCKPEKLEARMCYKVQYSDGVTDYAAMSDDEAYVIITFPEIIKEYIKNPENL